MRAVLDTNTVVSGLLWNGTPRSLLEFAQSSDLVVYSSAPMLSEFYRVLCYPKFSSKLMERKTTPAALLTLYAHFAVVVEPAEIPPVIVADPDDDMVLACAIAAQANLIVSGDAHLLDLGAYQSIPIMNAKDALAYVAG